MKKLLYPVLVTVFVALFSLSGCGGGAERLSEESENSASVSAPADGGDVAKGKELFVTTCSVCHGQNGEGIQGLGKNMAVSEFIAGQSDAELATLIKVGRGADDPLNTTGVPMPPKGGNPSLSEDDLYDLIAFIRTLQE
jgi:disulfide bond formation protein DsbB